MIERPNEDMNDIGSVAGLIWHYLHGQGTVTMTQLTKEVAAPRDAIMQGVGWLAREGKVDISKNSKNARVRQIRLIENGCG